MLDTWTVQRRGFDEKTAAQEESLFSVGNGYIGWRGNYEEDYSRPWGVKGCYINGFYETEKIRYGEIAYGYAEESQTMLNVTNGQQILLKANGTMLHPEQALETWRTLKMREGLLCRETVYAVAGGRLTVSVQRLASFTHPHVAAIRMTLEADTACQVSATALLDGDVTNTVCTDDPRVGSGLRGRVLSLPRMDGSAELCTMVQHTAHTHLAVACAMACQVKGSNDTALIFGETSIAQQFNFCLKPGQAVTVDKLVTYCTGEETQQDALLEQAIIEAKNATVLGFDRLAEEQAAYLTRFWHRSGIWVDGDDELLQGLRFNMYHLLQSAGRDGFTNIAAKGLTGEGYEGHYFWDTETYILPMFLHVMPEVARALLTYRYHILPKARERAREMGHPTGALFPWRTINGREASAYYPAGTAQVHIDADIALAIKRYWEATGDDDFMAEMGVEILCETARFYLDLGFYNPNRGGCFCINGVTGPDEYNAMVNNNAYTNLMAATDLSFAADAVGWLRENRREDFAILERKIGLMPHEAEAWRSAARKMYVPKDEQTGLIWQDDGFMERKPWPLECIPKENFPLLLHYHPLVIYRHQVCKQADTVLAMLLLPWRFSREEVTAAFEFYEQVTTHDSSLSMAAFSAVASRIGETDKAYRYFRETARLDLDDTHTNTRDGLHMANMAGTWVCVTAGFGGMQVTGEEISFAPVLPSQLTGYGFRVMVRGRLIDVHVNENGPHYTLMEGEPLTILDRGKKKRLCCAHHPAEV